MSYMEERKRDARIDNLRGEGERLRSIPFNVDWNARLR